MKKSCVLSLSGGMDSATLIPWVWACGWEIAAVVHFQYGSKHNPYEQVAVGCLVTRCDFSDRYVVADLGDAFSSIKSNLLAGGDEIPEGHYQADNMKLTVVPGRNMVFASLLASVAESRGADYVALGVHSGDHAIYPDCRPGFISALGATIRESTDNKVSVVAPFLDMDKEGILRFGMLAGLPYELTRTCYKDQRTACGRCGSCQERLEAFSRLGQRDPINYDTRELLPK